MTAPTPAGTRHVVVVGLMGSGKSTVAGHLARRLGWPLVDSDVAIAGTTGRTVRTLRDELGVAAMHDLEHAQLLDALAAPGPSVIAAAASIADDPACLAALAAPGVVVLWLRASVATLARRFGSSSHRPAFGTDTAAFLGRQAAARAPQLAALDPIVIDADRPLADVLAAAEYGVADV